MTDTVTALPASASRQATLFRFATAGSVDDGKSTLVGRLLHDAKAILADQLEQVAATSRQRGFAHGEFDFALLTDGLRAEREQGITIDVAYRYFATDRRSFILADCPGHVQYTRNMVTGAATADAVIVLVDARKGVVEQTRRHLAVVSLLRVPHVIVAVNKIDLIDFDEHRFVEIELEAARVAEQLGVSGLHVLPVSALEGDNIVDRSERTPWYQGATLIELLETLPSTDEAEAEESDFRLPVQLVLRPQGAISPTVAAEEAEQYRDFRGFAGRIAAGSVRVGDPVEVFPGGHETTVTGIHLAGADADQATAPQSVTLTLADEIDAARGAVITAAGTAPAGRREAVVELFQLDPRPIEWGAKVLVKHGTSTVQALVAEIIDRRDLETLAHHDAASLSVNEIGRVRLRFATELPLEPYAQSRSGGSLVLIHPTDGATLAAATVVEESATPTPHHP
ncbi:sulfate adenylyltransferase subunit 1 [Microbacterium sorbitolivorans]|uniref:sulfate adenylyltransferase n=1 Tax=Microbacterium sorbitolivorans TaxID=1867410 RepID=A0A367Y6F1_9MICO|nr:GTP-binding protein [Microbacterium sorbitolivorans]RCK61180.1 sulfate adenylyltransferase [Microbacterium sorbitolivorans]GGF34357.1 sulfate adenylyltransferase subunit 1 [Microbacterium sorbitolivorans]